MRRWTARQCNEVCSFPIPTGPLIKSSVDRRRRRPATPIQPSVSRARSGQTGAAPQGNCSSTSPSVSTARRERRRSGFPTQVRNRRHYHNSCSRNVTAGPRPISPGRPDRAGPGPATTRRPRRHGAQAPPRWHNSDPVCLALLRGKIRSSFHKRTTFLSPTSHLTRSSPGFGSR